MPSSNQPRLWVALGVTIAALLIVQQFWQWEVERIEVGAEKYLVRIHKWGKDLPADEILPPDESYKGVMLEVSPEGRYFLNPLFWTYELHELVQVPPGKCLVLTRKYGERILADRLARGEILALEGERGIVGQVKLPGSYRLNPYAYSWQLVPAIEVGADQVGVRTLKVGKDPRDLPPPATPNHYTVPAGYRGVQKEYVQPGTYYVNPYVETIAPVEVRSHRVELGDIEFPSRDGFILKPHVLVEYRVEPQKAPEVFVRLSDQGVLHQTDSTPEEQQQNEILRRVILPHIRGYARIEGSNFDARDFILTAAAKRDEKVINNRERLQQALAEKVKPRCEELGIEVRAVTLADMVPPADLAEQIKERDLARVELEKNKNLVGQFKEAQKLRGAEALKEQAHAKVDAETKLVQAKTLAEQNKQVQELKLKQELESAQLRLEAARLQAQAVLTTGKAEAAVIVAQNEAEVAGLRKAMEGFASPSVYAQYQILKRLAPTLKEIFASDDSEFSKLFSAYLTPAPGNGKRPAPVAAASRPAEGRATK
jgi:regulator of protease activity HflC (stomatin/prohibitin superfamily)